MARLSIGVERLGAEGFRLELGGRDDGNVVALAPGGGIRGRYEQDDAAITLHEIRADTLALSDFRWRLRDGTIQLAAPSRLTDVEIDARIGRGDVTPKFVGTIKAATLEATVDLTLGTTKLHGAAVVVKDFALTVGADGVLAVRLGNVAVGQLGVGTGRVEIDARDLVAPGPVTIDPNGVRVGAVEIGSLATRVPELGRKGSEPASPTAERKRGVPELPFLRHLFGKVALDLTTDVTLPIIGSRKATHRFRIPVDAGVISLDDLEGGLAGLENLVIDFEVEGDTLVLEKDIPLIPFDNKPLVLWSLDAEAQTLAKSKRVAIATLTRPRLPDAMKEDAAKTRKKGGQAVALRRLEVSGIAIDLRCGGPSELPLGDAQLTLGGVEKPTFGSLKIGGKLAHAPGDPNPGELTIGAADVHVGVGGIALGQRRLSIGELAIGALADGHVAFAGLRPQSVRAQMARVRLTDLHLSGPS